MFCSSQRSTFVSSEISSHQSCSFQNFTVFFSIHRDFRCTPPTPFKSVILTKWKLWEKTGAFILLFSTNYASTELSLTMTSERFKLLLHVLSVICRSEPTPRGETLLFFHLQEHSQMIPLGSPHWFLSLIPTFKAETEKEERSCMCVFVCVCLCQDSVSKCHGKRFMSLGGLVLNPTGMIEGSLNSDRFSKITTQRWRLRRTEKEKAKDSERR